MIGRWYRQVIDNPDDLAVVGDAFEWFTTQLEEARQDLDVQGKRLEDVMKRIPGWVEFRYAQLKEVEAIMFAVENRYEKELQAARKMYLEGYNRTLTAKQVEDYAANDPSVTPLRDLRDMVKLLRDEFVALTKGYEYLHYQLGNITKLRVANMEDAIL